eukprot:gene55251-53162_t
MFGAGVWDQPCVWCCGEACVPGGSSAAGDDGGVLGDRLAQAAPPGALCAPLAPGQTALRLRDGAKCSSYTSSSQCISHRDGAASGDAALFHGEPCVWCCGDGCAGPDTPRCAPRRFAVTRLSADGRFRTADDDGCAPQQLAPADGPKLRYREDIGCVDLTDRDSCVASRDGRVEFRDREEDDIWNQPCVCCITGGPARCEAKAAAEDKCPTERDVYEEGIGCIQHQDRQSCIAHRDGRSDMNVGRVSSSSSLELTCEVVGPAGAPPAHRHSHSSFAHLSDVPPELRSPGPRDNPLPFGASAEGVVGTHDAAAAAFAAAYAAAAAYDPPPHALPDEPRLPDAACADATR